MFPIIGFALCHVNKAEKTLSHCIEKAPLAPPLTFSFAAKTPLAADKCFTYKYRKNRRQLEMRLRFFSFVV
jgi:hypothetical protein